MCLLTRVQLVRASKHKMVHKYIYNTGALIRQGRRRSQQLFLLVMKVADQLCNNTNLNRELPTSSDYISPVWISNVWSSVVDYSTYFKCIRFSFANVDDHYTPWEIVRRLQDYNHFHILFLPQSISIEIIFPNMEIIIHFHKL